ncbi:hypothetical protein GGS23DRAFT_169235 [Durotheca rogersii]|uniref:uncharacterized protein n=1 Tax=Durotheca rogersii TaxID=419775 RepID=UPI002220B0DB|nr:uncharacterized protein GGS23DRAFT_169235 [Durotheca rogersii]KAI5867290.1 hypothetical protein GGS23DRAFT_169235 [Durotheca rogersii]
MRPLILASLPRACGCGGSIGGNAAVLAATPLSLRWATRRTFTTLPGLRPTVLARSPVFRSSTTSRVALVPGGGGAAPDVVPKTAITAHPALAGAASQVRCGPRATLERSSRLVRKRRHGFLSRLRTRNGRKMLQRRKDKKRTMLSN